jgi:hypothetical protein
MERDVFTELTIPEYIAQAFPVQLDPSSFVLAKGHPDE